MQEENNFYNKGWEKIKQKDYVGAKADFLKAFTTAEKESLARVLAFFSSGCVEIYLKQYDKALRTFTQVIEWHKQKKTPENEEYGRAYFNRGLAQAGLLKKDEAISDFNMALDYGSGAASYAAKAWRKLNQLGQFEEVESSPEAKPKSLVVPPAKAVAKSLPNAWGNNGKLEDVKKTLPQKPVQGSVGMNNGKRK
ncbi:MAG TPA: tetratricopeptide repeat protein [Gammaproteobacteria bacterium]|nr:tetratricopeptide repeat protein [Gammaproteobacteria bacterium]